MSKSIVFGALSLFVFSAAPVFAQVVAGRVKTVTGTVVLIRQKVEIPAKAGELLFEADGLRTGADGRIAVTLKDETRLSIGPNSDVRLDRFVYAPGEGRLGFTLMIARGLLAYVSGRIAKLSPDAVRLETPAAILGVRGTRLAIQVDP